MDPKGGSVAGSCYYSVLGIRKDASVSEIRTAYRRLAMRWHPDKWATSPSQAGEAKRRFQQIQEAYSVLSDGGKKAMYDSGMYDPHNDEDEGFYDFVQELVGMMNNVKDEGETLEDLQRSFDEIFGNSYRVNQNNDPTATKRARVTPTKGSAANRNTSR